MERELPQRSIISVAADGSGDYQSIGEAVAAVPDGNRAEVRIRIRRGIYEEKLLIPADKTHITLLGEDSSNTVIRWTDYAGRLWDNGDITGTFRSAAVTVRANWFHAANLTIENSYDGKKGSGGRQAPALSISGEHDSFENCVFLGRQDTLYLGEGSVYLKRCFIEGDTDFLFGGARAVLEQCQIHSVQKGEESGKSYTGCICAPSTPISQKYGFLFLDCHLTGDVPDGSVYLGRPWHPGLDPYAVGNAVFINCELRPHICPAGWTDMGGFLAKNARFYEFENTGSGAAAPGNETRPQLTREEAALYSKDRVLGWNPDTERGGL